MDEIRKLLNENAVLPLWPQTGRVLGLRRGATYAAAQSGEIRTVRFGRLLKVPTPWLKAKSGSASLRRDRNPADAHMLALRRAVRAQATPWPQQRQAARDAWSAPLSPGRPLLHSDLSQGCFQGATTFFNRRPEGAKSTAPIYPTIKRHQRRKF